MEVFMSDHGMSPACVGACAAIIGAGAGYSVSPSRQKLADLLVTDTFEKSFSEEVMRHAKPAQKESVERIALVREALRKGGSHTSLMESLKADYKNVKSLLPNPRIYGAVLGALAAGCIAMLAKIVSTPSTPPNAGAHPSVTKQPAHKNAAKMSG
jgi:hypothetical protein